MNFNFLLLLVFAVCVTSGNYIKKFGKDLRCYQCDSSSQPRCADFFDNTTVQLKPCRNDRNYTRCRKIIQEMYYDGSWERRYVRDCAVTGEIGAEEGRWCVDRVGTYRVKVRYCHCDNKEGCNSASHLGMGVLPILLFLVGSFLLRRVRLNPI